MFNEKGLQEKNFKKNFFNTGLLQNKKNFFSAGLLQNKKNFFSAGLLQNKKNFFSAGLLQNKKNFFSAGFLQSKKSAGQGTIEYLVIIAIVIVIALVVVGILFQLMGQGSGIGETSSQIAWRSGQPWAIIDWKLADGNLTLILQNNSPETLDLVSVSVGRGDDWSTGITGIPNGGRTDETQVIIRNTGIGSKTQYSFSKNDITISYNSPTISGKIQSGVADITGTSQ